MSWLQLEMALGTLDAERIEAALLGAGALSVTFTDAGNTPIYAPDTSTPSLWLATHITGLFRADTDLDDLRTRLRTTLGLKQLPAYRIEPLADREWAREWLKDFKPMCFGKRLWICPTAYTPPNPTAVNIFLDPGLAFGTGTHATTALCLEWLDRTDLVAKTVIDYGCGSGILAMAAAALGARHVWAVDTDRQALTASLENARRNRLRLHVVVPEGLPDMQADVLLANILAEPLRKLAPSFARLVRPGGNLLLSGILVSQKDALQTAYAPWFQFNAGARREEWLRMDGVRRENC